ncbi:hypothetical protein PL11_006180 [Lentilactobacillus curieae]|uniref:Uncharacterized protein n=1 Tax=Lentilactobacillus curieae TaxID=1138822 RepID=A0A1S6QIV5_9LACO|nr:hypothetical protein [Lentilactobacillus curieae]AQW21548.1 hypothetical protein PL11_006180 [Lentilactobacillus curieae]
MSVLLDDKEMSKNITAGQVTKVFYPFVIVKTEEGKTLKINLSKKEKTDSLFWEVMHRILEAKVWIPIGRHYHQILDGGWEATADPV